MSEAWLDVTRGDAPIVVSVPHAGTDLANLGSDLRSQWEATLDTDWYVDRLHEGAIALGATLVRTRISRTVIDVNRDPAGKSLYPGQATTDLCPTTTFDGDPLYRSMPPDSLEIERRRRTWFDPYHAALESELERLRDRHGSVVLYDAHSIRSRIPRLFSGELPQFNIGTHSGASCAPALTAAVAAACAATQLGHVVNGRFRGGWTTRHYGQPAKGVHAIQMELAMRGYLHEPAILTPQNWPQAFEPRRAAGLASALQGVLAVCIEFVHQQNQDSR